MNESDTAATFGTGQAEDPSIANLPTGNADRSIETWFKTSDTGHDVIAWWGTASPGEQMEIGIDGGDQLYLSGQYDDATLALGSSIADDTWHQLVVTYDGTSQTVTFYVDGQDEGSQTLASPLDTVVDSTGLAVGGPEYNGYYFNGDLDELSIYPTALTFPDVLNHYQASGRTAPGMPNAPPACGSPPGPTRPP